VLLKNERNVLPIRRHARVALVGSACSKPHAIDVATADWREGDYYVTGGSGRVVAPPERAFSIKRALEGRRADRGISLSVSETDSVEEALAAIAPASGEGAVEVVIACGGGVTSESYDRPSLRLDQDDFLTQLGAALAATPGAPPLVVLAMAPGQIVAPWATHASAAVAMFLAGQETGRAWAAVLLGDVSPSGKLPVTFPAAEEDMVPPCDGESCEYSEQLRVGWRNLVDRPVAFAFGHGLSYTNFSYGWRAPSSAEGASEAEGVSEAEVAMRLHVDVANTGATPGAEVAQLYVSFPPSAAEPPLVLRGFFKTAVLAPGEVAPLEFTLSPRDLSTWSTASAGWVRARGLFTFFVGGSSRDLRISRSVQL